MQIYVVLKKDHIKLKKLLASLAISQVGSVERKALAVAVKNELIPHSRAEEAVFYNGLREIRIEELKELLMGHGYGEHVQAENLLSIILNRKDVGMAVDPAKELKEAIEHHIEEEEGDMFTAAKIVLLDVEAEAMAKVFLRLKEEISQQDDETNMMELMMNMMPAKFEANPHHL